jgi:hypothetical protein
MVQSPQNREIAAEYAALEGWQNGYCTGLENRRPQGHQGSNPWPSVHPRYLSEGVGLVARGQERPSRARTFQKQLAVSPRRRDPRVNTFPSVPSRSTSYLRGSTRVKV